SRLQSDRRGRPAPVHLLVPRRRARQRGAVPPVDGGAGSRGPLRGAQPVATRPGPDPRIGTAPGGTQQAPPAAAVRRPPRPPPGYRGGIHVRSALRRGRVDRVRGRAAAPHRGATPVEAGGAGPIDPPPPPGARPELRPPSQSARPPRHASG